MTAADPMAPRSGASPTLCGPLAGVTMLTNDAAATSRFLTQALRMQRASDVVLTPPDIEQRHALWGLPRDSVCREQTFVGTDSTPAITVRVLVTAGGELIRPAMESRLTGGLSIGFPVASLEQTLTRVTALGYESTAGIVPLTITRPDGSSYVSGEILFRGPEQIYMLVVGRPSDMTPVGPIDAASGIGGPAYSAIVVPDAAREIEFYREVLGWEARQNIVLTTSGPAGGLGLDAGTQFRFVQLFAPGTTTAYVCLLDMMAVGRASPVAPRIPNRGVVMWTFGTRKFDEVEKRARTAVTKDALGSNLRVGGAPVARALTVHTPAGVMIEIVEQR